MANGSCSGARSLSRVTRAPGEVCVTHQLNDGVRVCMMTGDTRHAPTHSAPEVVVNSSRNKTFCRTVRGMGTAVALASLAVGTTAFGAWAAGADDPVQYVALGDSMASGPLIPGI